MDFRDMSLDLTHLFKRFETFRSEFEEKLRTSVARPKFRIALSRSKP